MKYVQTGFAGEGASDFDFLKPLVRRVVEELLLLESRYDCEIPDPVDIRPFGRIGNQPDEVVQEVLRDFPFLDFVFYHGDAGRDPRRTYENQVHRVKSALSTGIPVVGVVPRHEMEAWCIADFESLCRVLGIVPERIATPSAFRPSQVESIADPKAAFREFLLAVPTRTFRTEVAEVSLLGALALEVRLDVLNAVPQFNRLVQDTRDVLRELALL